MIVYNSHVQYVKVRRRVINCRLLAGPFWFHSKPRVSLGE